MPAACPAATRSNSGSRPEEHTLDDQGDPPQAGRVWHTAAAPAATCCDTLSGAAARAAGGHGLPQETGVELIAPKHRAQPQRPGTGLGNAPRRKIDTRKVPQ